MAYADYYHCDHCDAKAFYDAELNYDLSDVNPKTGGPKLDYVGDMKVLCDQCSEEYEVVVRRRD